MTVIVKTVKAIKNNPLKHRQFQQYLHELEYAYGDLLYFSKIRWLSREKCLEPLWNLKDEIKNFIKERCSNVPELEKINGFIIYVFLVTK